jgi:hypothetical protein
MHIQEIMSHPAIDGRSISTLDAAARLKWESDCGSAPSPNGSSHAIP